MEKSYLMELLNQPSLNKHCAQAFREIALYYYKSNFGTCSKTVIDSLMFKFVMEFLCPDMDDYELANNLGISEAKIRNKKMDCSIRYKISTGNIKDELKKSLKQCVIEKTENKISIATPTPNLIREISRISAQYRLVIEKDRYGTYVTMNRAHFYYLCCVVFDFVDEDGFIKEELTEELLKEIQLDTNYEKLKENEKSNIAGNMKKGLSWLANNIVFPVFNNVVSTYLSSKLM